MATSKRKKQPEIEGGAAIPTDATPAPKPTPPINAPTSSGKGFVVLRMGDAQSWDAERGMLQGYHLVPPTVFTDKEQAETRIRQTAERWAERDRDNYMHIFTIESVGRLHRRTP